MITMRIQIIALLVIFLSGCGTDIALDSDLDGLTDVEEGRLLTNPLVGDTDSDGISDAEELALGTNPLDRDSDHDGLDDAEELDLGTDPLTRDTDSDGLEDGEDALPLDPCLSAIDSFSKMAASSYAIVMTIETGPSSLDRVDFAIGTAFAIAPTRLATNAHVIRGIFEGRFPVERVVAIQSGTGRVITLLKAAVHKSFDNNPVNSPDVGVISTATTLPVFLELADNDEIADLVVGTELGLTGFPGDVNDLFRIIPEETVPQATSLTGRITAFRSFDTSVIVTQENVDIIQHQLPTSPGTSGSPLVRCGKVVAIHNAGTARIIVSVDNEGNIIPVIDPAASNNFGIHIKHLRVLIHNITQRLVTFDDFPPSDPNFSGSFTCEAYNNLGMSTHGFRLTVQSSDHVSGRSTWRSNSFRLTGEVDPFGGNVTFSDNAERFGFVGAEYAGTIAPNANGFDGVYVEGTRSGTWHCDRR